MSVFLARLADGFAPSATARVIQHALPSLEVVNEQVLNQRLIFFEVEVRGSDRLRGLNRNGYSSAALDAGGPVGWMLWLRYYDPQLGPVEMQPSLGLGPTPYDW